MRAGRIAVYFICTRIRGAFYRFATSHWNEERTTDVGRGDPGQHSRRERDLCFQRQGRMAPLGHETDPVVAEAAPPSSMNLVGPRP